MSRFIGAGYLHDNNEAKGDRHATFTATVEEDGIYDIRLAYTPHPNRATNVPVEVRHADGSDDVIVNMQKPGPLEAEFLSLGTFRFTPERRGAVIVSAKGTDGTVCADAIQIVPKQ